MAEIIKTTFQLRRGKASTWAKNNPVLAKGEPGFEYDTNQLKIGDGTTPWNSLPYVQGATGIITVATYAELPDIGSSTQLYRVIEDKSLYQYNAETLGYENLSNGSGIENIKIIDGGDASGNN